MPEICQFIQAMVIPLELQDTDPVDIVISTFNFQEGFKKIPDKVSSGPSSHHITLQAPSQRQRIVTHTNQGYHIGFSTWLLPYQMTHSYPIHAGKEPGNPLITKLRVTQLLEADMNFTFRLLWWKHLVHCTLSQIALTPLNFGVRPGCRVYSALLLKSLSYDYIRCSCLNAVIFNNDAKACFVRIIPSIGLMATERLGIPPTTSACMLATIQGMNFYIQTAHSVSPGFFTSTLSALILGVLQCSRAVPCI